MIIWGDSKSKKQKILSHCSRKRELVVFSVNKVKQFVVKTKDCAFESHSPRKNSMMHGIASCESNVAVRMEFPIVPEEIHTFG